MLGSPAMADVKPFRAVRYSERAGPLESSSRLRTTSSRTRSARSSLARNPHNVVHLTLPERRPRPAGSGASGESDGVLLDDDEPGFWWLSQDYVGPDGVARTREGLVAALRIEPYESRVVLPHERTHRGPKEGRLRLLREVRAQLEPLFFLHEGPPPASRPDASPTSRSRARASGASRRRDPGGLRRPAAPDRRRTPPLRDCARLPRRDRHAGERLRPGRPRQPRRPRA